MSESLKQTFDRSPPNTLPDAFRTIKLGQTLASDVKQTMRKANADASGGNPSNLATLDVFDLPDDAKAMTIFRAYARAGAGTLGELVVAAPNATPAAGEIAVTPNGDIALLAADAYTDVDVEFLPTRGDVLEVTDQVAADVMTLPDAVVSRGVVLLASVPASTGGAPGTKIVLAPGAGAPAAGQCRLNLAKSTITFAVADAITKATVRLVVVPEAELTSLLGGESTLL
jgi:hypothetical protein